MTSRELARRVGISLPWLHWLVQHGLIEPSIRKSRKQGSPAQWSEDDLVLVAAMKYARDELSRLGRRRVSPMRLRSLLKAQGLLIVGHDDVVSKVAPTMTIGQLLHAMGGSFAVLAIKS